MKQFSILNGKAHVVEAPESSWGHRIQVVDGKPYYRHQVEVEDDQMSHGEDVALPQGNWQIVGRLSEITEERAFDLVESYDGREDEAVGNTLFFMCYDDSGFTCDTALESLESSILAEGYLFTNPLGNEKEYKKKYKGHPMFFANHMAKWFEAQSRVLSRERCLLLMRVAG